MIFIPNFSKKTMNNRRLLLFLAVASVASCAPAQASPFAPPAVSRQAVTVNSAGVLVSPQNFFAANGLDLVDYTLTYADIPRLDWQLGRLYGPTGLFDLRLDWTERVLAGSWDAEALVTGELFVTEALVLPGQSISRVMIAPSAVGAGEIDPLGQYTMRDVTLDRALRLKAVAADPPDPVPGEAVIWMSNGAASGDAGDILIRVRVGEVTKTFTLVDFSAE